MECRILLDRGGLERVAVFESENGFVLGAVIFVNAANVWEQRHTPNEQEKQDQAHRPVNQIKQDLANERRIRLPEFRRRQQRQVFVHKNEEGKGDDHIAGGQPSADGGGFFAGFRLARVSRGRFCFASPVRQAQGRLQRDSRGGCLHVFLVAGVASDYFFDRNVGGEAQGAVAERHP